MPIDSYFALNLSFLWMHRVIAADLKVTLTAIQNQLSCIQDEVFEPHQMDNLNIWWDQVAGFINLNVGIELNFYFQACKPKFTVPEKNFKNHRNITNSLNVLTRLIKTLENIKGDTTKVKERLVQLAREISSYIKEIEIIHNRSEDDVIPLLLTNFSKNDLYKMEQGIMMNIDERYIPQIYRNKTDEEISHHLTEVFLLQNDILHSSDYVKTFRNYEAIYGKALRELMEKKEKTFVPLNQITTNVVVDVDIKKPKRSSSSSSSSSRSSSKGKKAKADFNIHSEITVDVPKVKIEVDKTNVKPISNIVPEIADSKIVIDVEPVIVPKI